MSAAIRRIARAVRAAAGIEAESPARAEQLARTLFGDDAFVLAPLPVAGSAAIVENDGRWQVCVPHGDDERARNYDLATAIGRHLLGRAALCSATVPAATDANLEALACELLAPRAAVKRATRASGGDEHGLAEHFALPERVMSSVVRNGVRGRAKVRTSNDAHRSAAA